jgi:glycosyltransferase involved in cell wall biosynthesis
VWALLPVELEPFNVLAWTPVDHFPTPREVLKFFHKNDARPLAMSRFGQTQLIEAGLPADYVPLAVDTSVYRRVDGMTINNEYVLNRELLDIPASADFVVAMVAMNKDPDDRKNFDGAFRAFGRFWRDHQNAVLYVHSDKHGIAGSHINLPELAKHAAIPPHAIVFSDTYALQMGFSAEMMACLYSAADVLLCPSKGEGFGVPMIEAQACGTPVIASDFTAQSELVGAGWKVSGQLLFDPRQNATYLQPFHSDIYTALTLAYQSKDDPGIRERAREFALEYDVAKVFEDHWLPVINSLSTGEPAADKAPMEKVAVIVPVLNRPQNVARLVESFRLTNDGTATLYFVCDEDDTAEIDAIAATRPALERNGDRLEYVDTHVRIIYADKGKSTYAQKVNKGVSHTTEDFVFVCGDDVEFTSGWMAAVKPLTDRFDVIGTNDSEPGRVRNPLVAKGSHADHFFVRREYVDDEGASLDGPGSLAPECYRHWYTDREIIELAKARGVFAPCLDSVVIHHHPGYDGDEDAREADPTYMLAVNESDKDHKTWMQRAPIVAGYRSR